MDQIDIEKIVARNGYCNCSDLTELFAQKKKAENLVTRCNNFRDEIDSSNAVASDSQFLENYKKSKNSLQLAVTDYYLMLNSYMDKGKLTPMLHEDNSERYVSALEARVSVKNKKAVSVHCSTCKQQIDFIC